jgi:nitrite reductase/ring-hydroxylating ferredoxin subunit
MFDFVKVAQISEVPAGQGKCVEVDGRRIGIFNVDGILYAIDDICPHQQASLSEGELKGKIITCPLHGWEYDVTTGVHTFDADLKQDQFEVQVRGSDIFIKVD